MLWLCIHIPNLAVQVFCRANSDDTALALAVCAAGPKRTVVGANHAALARGVVPGTRLTSALAVAPQLVVRARDTEAEAALLRELAGWALQFTPVASLDAPDCVVLEIAGSLRLFGGLEALCDQVVAGTAALGLETVVAVAPTPLAARWLARSRRPARVTNLAALPGALSPIALATLVDDGAPIALLEGLGCHTLGDCTRLPRTGLSQRGARHFNQQRDRAIGTTPDPRVPYTPPPSFAGRIELPVVSERDDMILFASRRLLTALCGALAARHALLERFTLVLEHEDLPESTLTIHLGAACRDEARCALLLREHLAARPLAAPAWAVRVEAADFQFSSGKNAALFASALETREAREVLIARLCARLGQEAVTQLAEVADHRPEHSWRKVAPGSAHPALPAADTPPRPLWLLAAPTRIATAGRTPWGAAQLTPISGPERIEAGWWDDADTLRDYYIARDEHGALLWVFQSLTPPHDWYVHGIFS